MTGKGFLSGVGVTGFLAAGLFFTPTPVRADHDNAGACRARLESSRNRLDQDVARHGDNSPRAQRDRERIEAARRWCKDHHADWDHDRYDNDHHEEHHDNDRDNDHHDNDHH